VLLLVAALRNAGAQGLAEVEAEAGSGRKRVASRRVLPWQQQQQAAAAPADVQQAAAVHGAARFWRRFGDLAGERRSWFGAGGRLVVSWELLCLFYIPKT